jgi:hypothetical protein
MLADAAAGFTESTVCCCVFDSLQLTSACDIVILTFCFLPDEFDSTSLVTADDNSGPDVECRSTFTAFFRLFPETHFSTLLKNMVQQMVFQGYSEMKRFSARVENPFDGITR